MDNCITLYIRVDHYSKLASHSLLFFLLEQAVLLSIVRDLSDTLNIFVKNPFVFWLTLLFEFEGWVDHCILVGFSPSL